MRAVHFRVEDDLYMRIQEEAEEQDLSVASFARVATVANALAPAIGTNRLVVPQDPNAIRPRITASQRPTPTASAGPER